MSEFLHKNSSKNSEKPFIVIVDIKDAFGSISIEKLQDILMKIVKKLPKTLYMQNLKYQYHDKKYITKVHISKEKYCPTRNLAVKNARFIKLENEAIIDTKKLLASIIRRSKN